MTSPVCRLLTLGTFLVLSSAVPAQEQPPLAAQARTVLKTYCHRCHHGQGSAGGNFDVLNEKTLLSDQDGEKAVIVPGKPDESKLWQRAGVKKTMPPKTITNRPGDADLEILRKWIEGGALPYPTEPNRPRFVSVMDVLTSQRDYLRDADPLDRPFLRFFTIHHLYNNPRVPEADLNVFRAGLSKAINSLSWKRRLVVPRAVDKEQTLFVVDLRDLDWDRESLWTAIMAAYPYALKFDTARDPALEKLDDDVRGLTQCPIPTIRADWFAATATRPPLYHLLLKLPKTAGELEAQLKVNVADNFLRDRLDRAGFKRSLVSEQNRLVERHASVYGAYWRSFDFNKDGDRADVMRFPLGPLFPGNPYPEVAFRQAGGEIIFHLPNGLQGYLLVNDKDHRIDEGPIDVVSDPQKTSGRNVIVNGLSCIACHQNGMKPLPPDAVRQGAAVFGDGLKKVGRLHVDPKHMAELLREDEDQFLKAVEKTTGPFLQVGPDKNKPIRAFSTEPVGEIARLYTLQELDLTMVAFELGLEKPATLKNRIEGNKALRELGLAPLMQDGGVLKRAEWEKGANSMMQRVARELELGTPTRVLAP